VFNIAHNEARLIPSIKYEDQTAIVLGILTHKEYDKGIAERPADIRPIDSETQHKAYVSRLLELQRQKTLNHRESDTVRLLILVIKDYEAKRYQFEDASPIEVLRELMDANGLKQRDLVDEVDELSSDSIVSEVLNGKRELNKNHIEKLSKRFNISPAAFF
jgi:HTH-type transcriptional regulator / antitoxin HigA